MTISGSIYFLGKYRPAYFEADSIGAVANAMMNSILHVEDSRLKWWLWEHILESHKHIKGNCESWSVDHCDRGVSFAKRPHDPFLDKAVADMPPCPGLDYSQSLNGR